MLALGLVETRGLVAAIEGADAMLKAADVHLLEKNLATGGLVTITVAGEVSAVQASVEAAKACILRMEGAELLSTHVIPRPDEELRGILKLDPEENSGDPESGPLPPSPQGGEKKKEERASGEEKPDTPRTLSLSQLKNMSLNRLRQLARTLDSLPLSGEEVASADKKTLIAAIGRILGN